MSHKARNRKRAKEQGFYDGRYKTKVVTDRKKELKKKLARQKIIYKQDEC
jgi:hypothetical protein